MSVVVLIFLSFFCQCFYFVREKKIAIIHSKFVQIVREFKNLGDIITDSRNHIKIKELIKCWFIVIEQGI